MTTVESATKILDTMLGHLGFPATIEAQDTHDGPCLQIHSGESEAIIGKDGDRLDDLQYLVNRILRRHQATTVSSGSPFPRNPQPLRLHEKIFLRLWHPR